MGETKCTSEKARGQFNIFGAIEENFLRMVFENRYGVKRIFRVWNQRENGELCAAMKMEEKFLVAVREDSPQGMHRLLTKAEPSGAKAPNHFGR